MRIRFIWNLIAKLIVFCFFGILFCGFIEKNNYFFCKFRATPTDKKCRTQTLNFQKGNS